jgi:hypothetical protein
MKTKLAVLGGVVALGAIAVIVWARSGSPSRHGRPDTTAVHATGIDEADTSVSLLAMLNAPDGATPCETAYLALAAEQEAARLHGGTSMFDWVAPKHEFIAACEALPAQTQQCMAPRYRREHDQPCVLARPPDAQLEKMFKAAPVVEEKLPGEE